MKLFGRSYETIGNSNSDFCIKTRGQVKIQWGSKFIDLIKDGKINVDSNFIYKSNSVGVKDGLYVIGEGDSQQVILQVGGEQITLIGEIGTTYVSFMGEQETTSDQKHQALTNIGFLYKDIADVDSTATQNGIVYIESEQKLYTIQDGTLTEFTIEFPNPYPKQLVIQKSDSDKGALLIKGTGVENSLAFDALYIYSENGNGFINAEQNLVIRIGSSDLITVSPDQVTFGNSVVSDKFQSVGATSSKGFRLYMENGESTLEVDNLIVRNGSSESSKNNSVSPQYWYYSNNIISAIEEYTNPDDPSQIGYAASLAYENQFSVGDALYLYVDSSDDIPTHLLIPLKVEGINTETENAIYVSIQQDQMDPEEYESLQGDTTILNRIVGQTVFQVGSSDETTIVPRVSQTGFDIISTSEFDEELDSRVGNLTDLGLKGLDNSQETDISGSGIYTKNLAALQAQYTSDYNLPSDDKSTKFASTEWVQNLAAPVDIDFTTDVVDFNIEDYLNQTEILNLINSQEDNTSNTYKGYHGQLTVMKENGVSTVSGMVRGKLKDGTYSYRTINGIYTETTWEGTSSYIIQNQFNPGYYWSSDQIDGIPVYPSYVGTTYEGFEVTSYKKYLWYTNDGDTWNLIREYIDPDSERIYIATSIKGIYAMSDGSSVYWPAGFVCYYNGSVQTPLGKSNFTSAPDSTVVPDLSKISSLTADAVAGYIPSNASYPFIWSIKSNDDKTVLSNWTLEKSYSLATSFNDDLQLDWGNLSVLTSNRWVKYDPSTKKITEILYPTTDDSTEYWKSVWGTLTNWQDATWRHYFLQTTIGMLLRANTQAYDETFGFNFSYTNLFKFKCFGFAGYIVGRSGAIKDPTSDDPDDIGYIPTPVFDFISGHLTAYGYNIDFFLQGLKIGKRLEGIGQASFNNSSIGAYVSMTNFYEIGDYTSWVINVTDMSTGILTVING